MGIFNIFKKSNKEKERALMKPLCLGIVGDIGRLLDKIHYNKPILTLELIVFASFIVAEVYTSVKSLNKKDLLVSTERLDGFHLDLLNYVINDGLKENIIKDESEILKFREEFYNFMQTRYQEYRPLFAEDISDVLKKKATTIFGFNILNNFLKHLFFEPISETELPNILVPMSLKLL